MQLVSLLLEGARLGGLEPELLGVVVRLDRLLELDPAALLVDELGFRVRDVGDGGRRAFELAVDVGDATLDRALAAGQCEGQSGSRPAPKSDTHDLLLSRRLGPLVGGTSDLDVLDFGLELLAGLAPFGLEKSGQCPKRLTWPTTRRTLIPSIFFD